MFTTLFLYNLFLVNGHGKDDNSDNHKNNRVEYRKQGTVKRKEALKDLQGNILV